MRLTKQRPVFSLSNFYAAQRSETRDFVLKTGFLKYRKGKFTSIYFSLMNVPVKQVFKAILENPDSSMDAAFVSIPFDVEKIYGTKGQVKVKALFDGVAYRGVLANMGTGCHVILVRKDIRTAIGKKVGDTVRVEIELDTEERVVEIPEPLAKLLTKNKKAAVFFDSLSYTNRKEYAHWISGAKKEETRTKRLAATLEKLLAGKKNPTEK
jgi:hypothetical protein